MEILETMLWALENCGGHFSREPETRIGWISVRNIRFCSGHIYTDVVGAPRPAQRETKKISDVLLCFLKPFCSPRFSSAACLCVFHCGRLLRQSELSSESSMWPLIKTATWTYTQNTFNLSQHCCCKGSFDLTSWKCWTSRMHFICTENLLRCLKKKK